MDKLSTNKTMTTKEVAEALGLKDNSSVTRIAKKCLPDKVIQRGKASVWTEEELTVLLTYMQTVNVNQFTVRKEVAGGVVVMNKTDNSKVLAKTSAGLPKSLAEIYSAIDKSNLEQLQQVATLGMQALSDMVATLKSENNNLKVALDTSKSFASVKLMEKLNPNRKFDWRVLKNKSKELSCKIEKCIDQNYGEVNAYSKDVWEACYELDNAPWD